MDSKCNTSTLLSSSLSKSRNNYNLHRGGNEQYIVGSLRKACKAHVKENRQNYDRKRHQNVAIATQVLNPSAIRGSFKNRRFIEHFGPRDDDQESFLNRKRNSACGKACSFLIATAMTLVLITGLILAVGYLQSEKQKIITRPVKLAQGQSFENLIGSTTNQSHIMIPNPYSKHSMSKEEDDLDEIDLDDYNEEDLQDLDKHNDISIVKNKYNGTSEFYDHDQSSKNMSLDKTNFSNGQIIFDSGTNNSLSPFIEQEVKVLPPADFAFDGISFEFPIYRDSDNNSTSKSNPREMYSDDTRQDTKELETSTNDLNANFTSLMDSKENEYEHEEEILSLLSQEDNYTNSYSQSEKDKNKNQISLLEISDNENPAKNANNAFDSNVEFSNNKYTERTNISKEKSNYDFETGSSTIKLNTEIFDNEGEADFETSASDKVVENERYLYRSRKPIEGDELDSKFEINSNILHSINKNKDIYNTTSNKQSSFSIVESFKEEDEDNRKKDRIDPKKLSLRPYQYRNRLKVNQNISLKDPMDKDETERDLGNGEKINHLIIQGVPKKDSSFPQSHSAPILEYKVDFSKFLSTTQSPKEPQNENVQLGLQLKTGDNNNYVNPYPVFNEFTTPEPSAINSVDLNYDFNDFQNFGNSYTKTNKNLNLDVPSAMRDFNLNLAQIQPFSTSQSQTISNFIPSGSSNSGSNVDETYINSPKDDQFSKRTFNNLDYDLSASGTSFFNKETTSSNPFAHLLGSQASTTGAFGSASSTGAALSFFQPQKQSFNLDASGSNPSGNFNIPSGIVPVDLSASHIPVNRPFQSPSFHNPTSVDYSYPNIDSSTNLGGAQGNTFSFNNYDNSNTGGFGTGNNNVPILTTRNGQVPNYNTITQGINLLKLLSGNINGPQQGFSSLDDDQQSSGSSSTSSLYQPNQYLETSLQPVQHIYRNDQISSLGSQNGFGSLSNGFLSNLDKSSQWKWKNSMNSNINDLSLSPSENLNTNRPVHSQSGGFNFNSNLNPIKNFRSFDSTEDQLPSASFSKMIVSNFKSSSQVGATTTEASLIRSLVPSVGQKYENKNEPKSLSISIISKPILPPLLDRSSTSRINKVTQTDPEPLIPKSRKRSFDDEIEKQESIVITSKANNTLTKIDSDLIDAERNVNEVLENIVKRPAGLLSGFYT